MNLNKGCIEIGADAPPNTSDSVMNLNKGCIEIATTYKKLSCFLR